MWNGPEYGCGAAVEMLGRGVLDGLVIYCGIRLSGFDVRSFYPTWSRIGDRQLHREQRINREIGGGKYMDIRHLDSLDGARMS